MNLPKALEWVRTTGVNTRHEGNRSIHWLYEYVRRAERQLPVCPDVFDREIERKTVTNGSDVKVFEKEVQGDVRCRDDAGEEDLAEGRPRPVLNGVAPLSAGHPRVAARDCSTSTCRATRPSRATLELFAALGDTLEVLDVSVCVGFAGTLDALKDLRKLRELYLYGCVALEGSVEPLGALQELLALDVEACFGLQGGVHVLAALPKLKILNISDTRLDAEGFVTVDAAALGGMGTKSLRCGGQRITVRRRRRAAVAGGDGRSAPCATPQTGPSSPWTITSPSQFFAFGNSNAVFFFLRVSPSSVNVSNK